MSAPDGERTPDATAEAVDSFLRTLTHRRKRRRPYAFAATAALLLVGCSADYFDTPDHDHSPATQPAVATDVDPARGDPQYWLSQEPAVSVTTSDYEKLWQAAERVSRDELFTIDRRDRRLGLLTTAPMISAQWFEPWRREQQTASDVLDSSTASIRRTVFWSFDRTPAGNAFTLTPKVLIERQSFPEKRITGVLSRAYFRDDPHDHAYGTRELDENVRLPGNYWFPVGRDFALERRLVEKVQSHL